MVDAPDRYRELRAFPRPVWIIFGAADPPVHARVARHIHELSPASELSAASEPAATCSGRTRWGCHDSSSPHP